MGRPEYPVDTDVVWVPTSSGEYGSLWDVERRHDPVSQRYLMDQLSLAQDEWDRQHLNQSLQDWNRDSEPSWSSSPTVCVPVDHWRSALVFLYTVLITFGIALPFLILTFLISFRIV
jgi:hypothetical protein